MTPPLGLRVRFFSKQKILCFPGRRAKILVFVAWLLSVLFSIPMLIFYNIHQHKGNQQGDPVVWVGSGFLNEDVSGSGSGFQNLVGSGSSLEIKVLILNFFCSIYCDHLIVIIVLNASFNHWENYLRQRKMYLLIC